MRFTAPSLYTELFEGRFPLFELLEPPPGPCSDELVSGGSHRGWLWAFGKGERSSKSFVGCWDR